MTVLDSNERENTWRATVLQGGGTYVGFSLGLVLFNSPTTGSTLALPPEQCTAFEVRKHIKESDAKFAQARSKRILKACGRRNTVRRSW